MIFVSLINFFFEISHFFNLKVESLVVSKILFLLPFLIIIYLLKMQNFSVKYS